MFCRPPPPVRQAFAVGGENTFAQTHAVSHRAVGFIRRLRGNDKKVGILGSHRTMSRGIVAFRRIHKQLGAVCTVVRNSGLYLYMRIV